MHTDISQEPFCERIQFTGKGAGSARACSVDISHKSSHILDKDNATSLRNRNALGRLRKAIFYARITKKLIIGNMAPQEVRRACCTSLRSQTAHGHAARTSSCRNSQAKCRTPGPRCTFCSSLRTHGHVREEMPRPGPQHPFLREPPQFAIEIRLDMSQELSYARICR